MKVVRWIAFNMEGRRIGQAHPRAKFSDREVDLAFELAHSGFTLAEISQKLEIPKSTVCRWLNGQRRGQAAVRWEKGEGYGNTQKLAR